MPSIMVHVDVFKVREFIFKNLRYAYQSRTIEGIMHRDILVVSPTSGIRGRLASLIDFFNAHVIAAVERKLGFGSAGET
jgi:hypothetical protein